MHYIALKVAITEGLQSAFASLRPFRKQPGNAKSLCPAYPPQLTFLKGTYLRVLEEHGYCWFDLTPQSLSLSLSPVSVWATPIAQASISILIGVLKVSSPKKIGKGIASMTTINCQCEVPAQKLEPCDYFE